MTRRSVLEYIGLAGVAENENPTAKKWGRFFELPMLLMAIWISIEWYLSAKGAYPKGWETLTNWVVWLFFVTETVFLCCLVRHKRRYLVGNWVNLLIIAVGLPILWHDNPYAGALRSLRILLLLRFGLELSSTLRQVLARNNIGLTLLVSLIIIVMAGTSIAAIDPAIDTPWDGIWWAWVTVTTVGYGDIVPESGYGRVFGGFLMVLGLGLFSLITASFSALLIAREEEGMIQEEEKLIEKEKEVIDEEIRTLKKLERIEGRLDRLEKSLSKLIDRLP